MLGGDFAEQLGEIERAERLEQQKHAEHNAEIADAVDDERFLACVRRGLFQEIEADQQIAGETHAFPPNEKQNVVGGEHQDQHEEHEEIQVAEEAVVAAFMRHVSGGVDVNEEPDAGDH